MRPSAKCSCLPDFLDYVSTTTGEGATPKDPVPEMVVDRQGKKMSPVGATKKREEDKSPLPKWNPQTAQYTSYHDFREALAKEDVRISSTEKFRRALNTQKVGTGGDQHISVNPTS